MNNQQNKPLLRKQPIFVLSLAVFILIISGGYFYYLYEKKIIRQEQYNYLKSIADLKTDQIVHWREERLADADVFLETFIRQKFQQWLYSHDSTLRNELLDRFSLLRSYYKYEDVSIVSTEGILLFGLDTILKHIDSEISDNCKKALQERKTFLGDLYFCPAHDTIHLDVFAPILSDKNVPVAVLVLRVNPFDFLYPLFQSWPTPSKSAETLIIRKDGDSILYVNELRHISNTALKLRIPLTSIEVPAVQAVLGSTGIIEGTDYRGVRVLADMRQVPGSPWYMIAKVDQSEIFSELKYRTVIVIIITLLLLLFSGIGISLLYNNRQKNIYRRLLETGMALEESQIEFRTTLYSIGDAVITTDIKGCIRNMNMVAEKLTGWKESDGAGRNIGDVFNIVNEETGDKVESPVHRVLKEGLVVGLANHTLLISKDGKEIPIADSGAPIRNEKGDITGVVLVFRDQTREREAQKALQESERKFRETVKYLDEGYYSCLMDGIVLEHNRAFNRILGIDISKDMKGSKLPDFWLNPDERNAYLQELMTMGFIMNYQIDVKTISGEKVVVLVNSHLVKDEKGDPVRIEGTFTDYTELKRKEESLRRSEKDLRESQRIAQVGSWRMDVATNQVVWTEELYNMYGFDPSVPPPPYTEHMKLFTPESWERLSTALTHTRETGIPYTLELETVRNDGSNGWMWVRGEADVDSAGKIVGLWGAAQDITGRKSVVEELHASNQQLWETERQLRQSVELLDATGRMAKVGGWEVDAKTLEVKWTEQTYRLHEVPFDAKPPLEEAINFFHPEEQPKLEEAIHRALEHGEPYDMEIRFITARGNHLWTHTYCEPEIVDGKTVRLKGVFQDITERKLVEEALKEQHDFSESLIETAQTIILVLDTQGRIVRFNPYMEKLVGYNLDEVKGMDWFGIFLTPELSRTIKPIFLNAVNDIHNKGNINPIITKDGRPILVEWYNKTLKDKDGHTVGILSIGQDITERKQAEEEIRKLNAELEDRVAIRTSQLEASNKELEAFSYSVSHDLRAPLRHVSGYVELLHKHFQSDLPEKGQHYLNSISDSTRIMGMLIDDLLQFSRTGRTEMRQSDCDMNEVVKEVIESLAKDFPDRKIEWARGKLPSVYGDKAMLRIVWINLLSNAVKFTRTRKKAMIEIGVRKENKELVFFVRDNGVGFEMQYAQKLFGVFQRLHPAEEFEGTGIGLANVQRIVSRHGGRAWAEAEHDKGAAFYFSIPNQ